MYADSFDYKTAAGLHRDRLNEAEAIRRALSAKRAAAAAHAKTALAEKNRRMHQADVTLKHRIGRQLIAIGEKMTA